MQRTPEHVRTNGVEREHWRRWGTYLVDRSWGTVREGTPDDDDAWSSFPFEQARSRAYRWAEDGIGGFSDIGQRLCMSLAVWNGVDPILKERFFGLTNEQGNHGEDIKDYFFLLDGVPSYSYMKMLYRYPHAEYPYERLVRENAARGQGDPEFNLVDALESTFAENRFFDIFIEYAKDGPDDILCRITVTNCAGDAAPLHILPHLFFRNTWQHGGERPQLRANGQAAVLVDHPDFAGFCWHIEPQAALLFTENETNTALLYDQANASPFTKDGIDYAVVRGHQERVNDAQTGSKCAAHIVHEFAAGETLVVRTRLSPSALKKPFQDFDAIFEQRRKEADAFYDAVQRDDLSDEQRSIQRTAFGALCWNNTFYHFNIKRWLDDKQPDGEPSDRRKTFKTWEHFDAQDILSVPDPWEYPWLATWDIDFQITTISLIDPEYAKQHTLLLLDKRYMRENGEVPAFEGDLSTPHPPVHAWSAWHIYHYGEPDRAFLHAAYQRLKPNFDWWLEHHQPEPGLFDGGFLGKDNISLIDRNTDIPEGGAILQADSTGWMAFFALDMLEMAIELKKDDDACQFLFHFLDIRKALGSLWDRKERYYFDNVVLPGGKRVPLKVRSLAGMIPLLASASINPQSLDGLPLLYAEIARAATTDPDFKPGADGCILLSAVPHRQISHLLNVLFDPDEFYGPYGLRSLSKAHDKQPVSVELGGKTHELRYEPGESPDRTFGGNSNWRGPIWAPLNQIAIEALYLYHDHFAKPFVKRGSRKIKLDTAARELVERLVSMFEPDEEGKRPCQGQNEYIQTDPLWRDYFWFFEYFHGDKGVGLGAAHQNGWTAMIAMLIQTGGRPPRTSD